MEAVLKIGLLTGGIALIAILVAIPVMWLWNWLMPDLFGLKVIGVWQALGISLLCSILFKGHATK